jgi:hypothetical protein
MTAAENTTLWALHDALIGRHALQALGHDWVDVFKIDVEGSEYGTFEYLTSHKDGMRFTQVQVEIHFGMTDGAVGARNANVRQLKLLESLMQKGFRVFNFEPNIYFAGQTCHEFSLINMDICGNVVTPR